MPISPPLTPLPQPVTAVVALEPVYSILMSMAALYGAENYSGLDDWVLATVNRMRPALREQHDLLFPWLWLDALTNAVVRGPATASFPTYLAALAAQPATTLRDTLLHWLIHSPHLRVSYEFRSITPPNAADLLADYHVFTAFIEERLRVKVDEIDQQGAQQIHTLFTQPAQLQSALVTHLQLLWDEHVAAEWERVQPKLQATVDAFQNVRLEGLSILEAIQTVTGRDLRPAFRLDTLLTYRRVRFIPHLHNGPYILWFGDDEELRIGFAAHQPAAATTVAFDLTTLVNRYKALADETRLAILLALRNGEEISTQAVIDQFGLDKSTASRHLRQLVATSLIEERREEGARKVYRLRQAAVTELIKMLSTL